MAIIASTRCISLLRLATKVSIYQRCKQVYICLPVCLVMKKVGRYHRYDTPPTQHYSVIYYNQLNYSGAYTISPLPQKISIRTNWDYFLYCPGLRGGLLAIQRGSQKLRMGKCRKMEFSTCNQLSGIVWRARHYQLVHSYMLTSIVFAV